MSRVSASSTTTDYEEADSRDISESFDDEQEHSVEDYGDDSDFGSESEEEEEEEPVVKEAKSSRKRKRPLPTKYEKMMKASKALSDRFKQDHVAAAMQFKMGKEDDEKLQKRLEKEAREKKGVFVLRNTEAKEYLSTPVGFSDTKEDMHTLEHRIINSKKQEFKIERTLFLKRTRYIPFGSEDFYRKTVKFYSEPTDLCCQWCTEPFQTLPIPIPVRHRQNPQNRDDFLFHVTGQFCSPSCMLAKMKAQGRVLAMGRLLLKKLYGLDIKLDIPCAPDPLSLKKFGGMYTIDQFRATGGSGITSLVIKPPLIPVSIGITEIEKTETVVTEIGGKELARRRISVRGGGMAGTNAMTPFSNPSKKRMQKGKFSTAPTIEEQIDASDRKLRLQMNDEAKNSRKKRANIMNFMKLKENVI